MNAERLRKMDLEWITRRMITELHSAIDSCLCASLTDTDRLRIKNAVEICIMEHMQITTTDIVALVKREMLVRK